jgi:hypothetical protein
MGEVLILNHIFTEREYWVVGVAEFIGWSLYVYATLAPSFA